MTGARFGPHGAEGRRQRIQVIGRLAHLLDDAFVVPGTRVRMGLDPIVGLVPWLGDLLSAAFAGFIVIEAFRLRTPLVVVARMVLNVVFDLVAGIVPVVGDLFDVAYKANIRNFTLLERHAGQGRPPGVGDYLIVGTFLAALAGIALLPLVLFILLLRTVGRPLA